MLGQSISKNSFILGAFAMVTAGVLAFTFLGTKEKIAVEERKAAQKALLDIVPLSRHNNDILNEVWDIPSEHLAQLGLPEASSVHIAKQDGQAVAAIIPAITPEGYSGDIKLIVGINLDGTIAGARVLVHRETPGLGDKIDLNKSDWILSFDGKSLTNPESDLWKVKKEGGEFDQLTGATITPRAVVNRIKTTLEYFEANKAQIFANAQQSTSPDLTTAE